MNENQYLLIKITVGVIATIGLYSVLYRETKVYRFFEHIFLGLAAGYTLVATWKDTLFNDWFVRMFGRAADAATGQEAQVGYWIYAALLPIGLMGYMVFNRKHNWMSKIPLGIILGLWSGQQIQIWWDTWGPQIYATMKPVIPTTFESLTRPATVEVANGRLVPIQDPTRAAEIQALIGQNVYASQALSNLVFVLTFVSAFSYFIFSFDLKGKFLTGINTFGRWMLMIGFGAIFGSTVMARFALVIDRMSYIVNEWLTALLGRGV